MADEEHRESSQDPDESSSNGGTSDEDEAPVESLIAGREKRSTAGNRLSTLLDKEADDELELLFAEDEEDVEFEGEGADDASDVQFDSSSSDDEDQGPAGTPGDEDLEGEKELQKQARAERQAKKRKTQDSFFKPPALRNKKVKVDPTVVKDASTTPASRPKKKSERLSWIPTVEEGPTRSSSRKLTVQNKAVIHARMKETEKRRIQQIAVMEAAAKRKEQNKPKEMTQADRLAEAEKIEQLNSKSLNRWEETEKKRAEEQRARLEALHNRQLDGPVISYWSGPIEWVNGKAVHVGKRMTIKDVKTEPVDGSNEGEDIDTLNDNDAVMIDADKRTPTPKTQLPSSPDGKIQESDTSPVADPKSEAPKEQAEPEPTKTQTDEHESMKIQIDDEQEPPVPVSPSIMKSQSDKPKSELESSREAQLQEGRPEASPAAQQKDGNPISPTTQPQNGEPAASAIVHPKEGDNSNVVASTTGQSSANDSTKHQAPEPPRGSENFPDGIQHDTSLSEQEQQQKATPDPLNIHIDAPTTSPQPQPPPVIEYSARNLVVLKNFDPIAVRDKDTQRRILFKRRGGWTRPQKATTEQCVITARVAKFRDPATGLPYLNSYAYKEIQKLEGGSCRWSNLLGCFVGPVGTAAMGVPERFLGTPTTMTMATPATMAQKDGKTNGTVGPGAGAGATPAPTAPVAPVATAANPTPTPTIAGKTAAEEK